MHTTLYFCKEIDNQRIPNYPENVNFVGYRLQFKSRRQKGNEKEPKEFKKRDREKAKSGEILKLFRGVIYSSSDSDTSQKE